MLQNRQQCHGEIFMIYSNQYEGDGLLSHKHVCMLELLLTHFASSSTPCEMLLNAFTHPSHVNVNIPVTLVVGC